MPIEQKSYDSTIMGGIPYYDDFNQQKKFLKILFKPGLPVQARELSQAQTILQNQIERLGSNIFRNGSVVLGGGVSTTTANFIRLQSELPLATLKRMVNLKFCSSNTPQLVNLSLPKLFSQSVWATLVYQIQFYPTL